LAKVRHIENMTGCDWQPTEFSVVCLEHFNNEDFYYVSLQKRLKPGAVPSVFSYNWTTKSDWQWLPLMNMYFRFCIQHRTSTRSLSTWCQGIHTKH